MKQSGKKIRIAVSGDVGSFSEEAGRLYAGKNNLDADIHFAIDMEGVLAEVDNGKADIGIFCVVNSIGGIVDSAFAAMGKYPFLYKESFPLEVMQCFMAKPEVKKENIIQIASHSQALAQCQRYLFHNFNKAKLIEWIDTAKAAKDLADGEFGVLTDQTAVIAPARAAEIYGLQIIEKGIQDVHPNLTTFIVVTKRI